MLSKCLLIVSFAVLAWGQASSDIARHIGYGATLPPTCSPLTGDVFYLTSGPVGIYTCVALNTWSSGPSGGPAGPAGAAGAAGAPGPIGGSVSYTTAVTSDGNTLLAGITALTHGQGAHVILEMRDSSNNLFQPDAQIDAFGNVTFPRSISAGNYIITVFGGPGGFNNPLVTTSQAIGLNASGLAIPVSVPINLMTYGALCDGSTDDTAAFAAAAAALTAGQSLFVPGSANGCKIATSLSITGLSNVNITGAGWGSKLIFSGTPDYAFTLTNASNVTVRDLQFAGTGTNGQLFRLISPSNVRVKNCKFTGGGTKSIVDFIAAVYFVNNTSDVWLEDSTFTGNGPAQNQSNVTAFSITSNVVTVTASNAYASGNIVTISGLTTGTYLNNQRLTLTGATGSTFTAAFTHANVGSTSDTGTATIVPIGSDFVATASTYISRVHVRGNAINNSNSLASISVINCSQCDVQDNDIDGNNAYSGLNADGYGIVIHGESEVAATSATRTSGGVVTITTASAHSFAPGQHIDVVAMASSGGTVFIGDFDAIAPTSGTTITYQLPVGAGGTGADTGTGGFVAGAPVGQVVSGNKVRNTSGTAIYNKNTFSTSISGNTLSNFGKRQDDSLLCVAGIGSGGKSNVISANPISDSVKDGICTFGAFNQTINGGTITRVRHGVYLRSGVADVVQGLEISNVSADAIFSVTNTIGAQIQHNHIDLGVSGGTLNGIVLGGGFTFADVLVQNNEVSGGATQFLATGAVRYTVSGNKFMNGTTGSILVGADSLITNNVFVFLTGNGLQDACVDCIYSHNLAVANGSFGIYLGNTTRPIASNNFLAGNGNNTYGTPTGTGTNTNVGFVDTLTGFQVNEAGPSGHYLRGNGTAYVDSTVQASDLPFAVTPKTSNYSVLAGDTLGTFTNTGASGEVDFTLPAAVIGMRYTFVVEASQTFKVIATGGAHIRNVSTAGAANGSIDNLNTGGSAIIADIGSIAELQAVTATEWVARVNTPWRIQ